MRRLIATFRESLEKGALFSFPMRLRRLRLASVFLSMLFISTVVLELNPKYFEVPELYYLAKAQGMGLAVGLIGVLVLRIIFGLGNLTARLRAEWINLIFALTAGMALLIEPRIASALLLLRFFYLMIVGGLTHLVGNGSNIWASLSPAKTLALSFIGMISFGALLLLFPASTADGQGTSLTDAFFTMASATSVTGLIVQDTGTYFSTFGLLVILVIMQTGAIGIMVLAGAFAVLIGGRLSNQQQAGFEEAGFAEIVDVRTIDGLKRLVYSVTLATFAIEFLGMVVLYLLWLTDIMPLREIYDTPLSALWWCLFHSISAFCHAGFSLEPDSLVRWVENPTVNIVFMLLITLGAVGFPVLVDLAPRQGGLRLLLQPSLLWKNFHIQTKVVLVATAILNIAGMLLYLYFEFDESLNHLGLFDKVMAALFQSVTLRSAGFNTVPISEITAPTVVFTVVFMFIGSAPASTGGGVRITTMAVVMMAIRTMLLGREDVEIFGRRLPETLVYRAISIVLVAGIVASIAFMGVVASQPFGFQELLFETISAFGTVGLSMGITAELNDTGKWIMTFLMYFGRVGPITLALAIGERFTSRDYRFPKGRLAVG